MCKEYTVKIEHIQKKVFSRIKIVYKEKNNDEFPGHCLHPFLTNKFYCHC